jgi:hypothetical protein
VVGWCRYFQRLSHSTESIHNLYQIAVFGCLFVLSMGSFSIRGLAAMHGAGRR